MEKKEDDDSSFKARVDKIFGSLSSKSAWSLTDDEIQKKEWRRREKHADSDEDEDDDGGRENAALTTAPSSSSSSSAAFNLKKKKPNDFKDEEGDDDEEEIRASIGLDPTLDYEAEEDEYDKVAEGRENAGERLYMKDVTDHGPYLNSHNVLPDSIHDAIKDSRANHLAAKARLEEDKAESLKIRNNLFSKKAIENNNNKPKPVLKMKNSSSSSSSSKGQRRVRFDPYCKNKSEEDNNQTPIPAVQTTASDYQEWVKNSPAIPDYLVNPSKYKCYTFDSTTEFDYMEVINSDKTSNPNEAPLHYNLKFTPRKKESGGDGATPMDSSDKPSRFARGIAAVEKETSDEMEVEDEDDVRESEAINIKRKNQKPGRHYRPRPKSDDPMS